MLKLYPANKGIRFGFVVLVLKKLNQFWPMISLYTPPPLKTPINLLFSDGFRGYRNGLNLLTVS